LNAGPDHLSHIETGEEPTDLEEGLPDAQFFAVHVADSHFEDIMHFLMKRMAMEGYTSQQKKELVVHTVDLLYDSRFDKFPWKLRIHWLRCISSRRLPMV